MTKTTAAPAAAAAPVAAPAKAAAAAPAKAAAPAAPATPAAGTPEAKTAAAAAPEFGAGVPALGAAAEEPKETAVPALGDADTESDAELAEDADGAEEGDEPAAEDTETDDGTDETPIAYDFEAPEGSPPYREPVINAYKDVLQKHKVAPEVAKDILEAVLPAIQADTDAQVKAHVEAQTAEWREQLQQRHGAKLTDVMRMANRALGKGASPELTNFLRDSALAVNPDFIDMLAFFGQRVSNDRSVKPTESAPKQPLSAVDEAALEYERNDKQRGQ